MRRGPAAVRAPEVDRPRAIGQSLPRREDDRLLRGTAEFIDDVPASGALHVAFLRSTVAQARVLRVDVAAAASAAGVSTVVSAADLNLGPLVAPIENPDATLTPRPLLAESAVRFVGEPIALVVAGNRYQAEDACELIEVELELLPCVASIEEALAEGGAIVEGYASNVIFDSRIEAGDVDAAFAAAAATVQCTFENPRCTAVPIEPRGVLAVPEGGGVTLWSSTQAPHKLSQIVAELLGLERASVRVVVPDVGGGFGQKAHAYPEEILVAWLALRLARPVKWIEDRAENLIASSHARNQRVEVRAAAAADGTLLVVEADVVCDVGAFGVYPHGHTLEALGTPAMIPGPYRLGNYRARSRAVATNKCPEGAYRGVGLPVATFIHERVIDLLAGRLGLDPAVVRRRNLLTPEELPYMSVTGQRYDSGDYLQALERALAEIDYEGFRRRQADAAGDGRRLGIGLSCYVEWTAPNSRVFSGRGMVGIAGYDGAHVALEDDGSAVVWTTLPAIGQGVETTFAQLAADELGMPVESVRVARADTSIGDLHGTGTFASRSAVSGGGAIREACLEVRRRLLEDGGTRLEADVRDLELADGAVHVVGSPASDVPIAELVAAAEPERYRVSATFDPPAVGYAYATHAAIVEVDSETGHIAIRRYVVVEDCGTVINPVILEGQIHGAVAQGIGGALYEDVVYGPDGQPLAASLMDYLIPTAGDLPNLDISHLCIPAPGSPHGAKGVGEGGTLAPPGALANAVADALDVDLNELPLSPERVATATPRTAGVR
jgi:carbon-monoxide dehydrogenase large subunit